MERCRCGLSEWDDESAEWEKEQLRRGGQLKSHLEMVAPKNEVYKPAAIPEETFIPFISSVVKQLAEQITTLTASYDANLSSIEEFSKERAEFQKKEKEIREMVVRADEKRAWFEQFGDWLEGMAIFLDEKYPILEKLEQEHVSLVQERFDMISKRRCADDEDNLLAIYGLLPISPPADDDSEKESEQLYFKQVISTSIEERRALRIQRRHRRRQESPPQPQKEDGCSTDSFLPPEHDVTLKQGLHSIVLQSKEVLADVQAEEFLDPARGLWSTWRDIYRESYINAYGGLGVVSVWEFWVRLEIVGWNCIEDSRNLDTFHWYQGLYAYSRPGEPGGEHDLGPDGDLVATMVSKAVIPRISAVIHGGAVDPYSERHIRRLVHVAEEIQATVEGLNDAQAKLQSFLQSIVVIFRKAIEETSALLMRFKAKQQTTTFDPKSILARRQFLARRMKLVENLLRWRKFVNQRSNLDFLLKQVVEDCFLDVALGGWEVGGEELSKKMVEILPGELVTYELRRRLGA